MIRKGRLASLFGFWSLSALAVEGGFVGSERCQPCHQKSYAIWLLSAHAKAISSIPEDKRSELKCLFCHATDVQERLREWKFTNVQCEACHGPGEKHILLARQKTEDNAKPGGLAAVTEKRCRECHASVRSPSIRPFEFDSARERIRHW